MLTGSKYFHDAYVESWYGEYEESDKTTKHVEDKIWRGTQWLLINQTS